MALGSLGFGSEAKGVFALHFLEIFGGGRSSELAVIDFLERVDVWAHGFFVDHEGNAFGPPAVEGFCEVGDDGGVLVCYVGLLGVV